MNALFKHLRLAPALALAGALSLSGCGGEPAQVAEAPESTATPTTAPPTATPTPIPFELKVFVRGSLDGLPIGGATVVLSVAGGEFNSEQTSPSAGGLTWEDLPGGEAIITVSKEGYRPHEEKVTLERGSNTVVIMIQRAATPTPAISAELYSITDVEAALKDDGYRRFPFSTSAGTSGFTWVRENPYENVTTFEDGRIEMDVLHDSSPAIRTEHMEPKLAVLARVFSPAFMEELRAQHEDYNRSVSATVTGEPDWVSASGGQWQTVWAEYYISESRIGGYDVKFSLWWWQSTCPPQYAYCYYESFPGLEFTGDSSFVFYTILLRPARGPGVGEDA